VSRYIDPGAIFAGWVGLGMGVVIAVSFLLVIPIEPVFWLLSVPAGILIGYYANQRAGRQGGPWWRILANGLYAALVTALTLVILLLLVKAIFFFADSGFRDPGAGGNLVCSSGPACVYARYLDQPGGPAGLAGAGVTDTGSFTAFYWSQQFSTAITVLAVTLFGGLIGAVLFGVTQRRGQRLPAG
jgi:hypothetical protein